MDTGHPCRQKLPTIVHRFCNEPEIINIKNTAGQPAQANYTVVYYLQLNWSMYGEYGKYTKGKDICNCTETVYEARRRTIPGYPYMAPCCVDVKRNLLRMFAQEMDKYNVSYCSIQAQLSDFWSLDGVDGPLDSTPFVRRLY